MGDRCSICVGTLEGRRYDDRLVVESSPVKAAQIPYRLLKQYGPQCQWTFQPQAPAVLPKRLYGKHMLFESVPILAWSDGVGLLTVSHQDLSR